MEKLGNQRKKDNFLTSHPKLIEILLKDRTTRKNIIWATDSYAKMGDQYQMKDTIEAHLLQNGASALIKPRLEKDLEEQKERTRGKAEVFTPTWIVEKQNNVIEDELKNLSFKKYIQYKWLEITCGEAPYMVTRYDTVSGKWLPLNERVGFVDRKLQKISKEIHEEKDWLKWTIMAYQASYGYEFQGDSLFLARENLLYTFIDYYEEKFGKEPQYEEIEKIAKIISYNVFQMDGLKYIVPLTEETELKEPNTQLNLFGEPEENVQLEMSVKEGRKVKTKNWLNNQLIEFQRILSNEGSNIDMKFDVVIGNPPYQEDRAGTRAKQIYPEFMEAAYEIGEKVILITPGRFLFNAGDTPKKWNNKMLKDPHLKVLFYEEDNTKIFQNTDIKGGIAITYRNQSKKTIPIDTFVPYTALNSILEKINSDLKKSNLSEITFTAQGYKLTEKFHNDYQKESKELPNKTLVTTNIFDKFPHIFIKNNNLNNEKYIELFGRMNKIGRVSRWVKKEYIEVVQNFDKWKVLLPKSNGSGKFGESLSSPFVTPPYTGHTQTFMSIGMFNTKKEAKAGLKYIKTKFLRALLSILKATQDNPPTTWSKIPLQDFSEASDIDWTKSVAEIDRQLYQKYGLNDEEINFIENNVKEME